MKIKMIMILAINFIDFVPDVLILHGVIKLRLTFRGLASVVD